MLRILIVDDEYLILKGLEIVLKEQTQVSLQIETALNAAQAFEHCETMIPDVIIADICMPQTDGLSMLEAFAKRFPFCRFIICSGHENADYLKRAIKLHVAEYLLKPIDKHALITALCQLDKQHSERSSTLLHYLHVVLSSGVYHTSIPEKDFHFLFPYSNYIVCFYQSSTDFNNHLQEHFSHYFHKFYFFSFGSQYLFIINYKQTLTKEAIYQLFQTEFSLKNFGLSFYSVESSESAMPCLVSLYHRAFLDYFLSIFSFSESTHNALFQVIMQHTFSSSLKLVNHEETIESYLQEIISFFPDHLIYEIAFIEIISAYMLNTSNTIPTNLILEMYHSKADSKQDFYELIRFFKHVLNSFLYDSSANTTQYSDKINTACSYIHEHYSEDITLDQLADLLCLNSSYLSYSFKKETGVTFLQYLTDVRMKQACYFMKTHPDWSIEQIADLTGYHSVSYFHKIFRSKYGVSPRQWIQDK